MPTKKTLTWLLAATALYLIAWNIGGGWLYAIIAILVAFPLGSVIMSRFNTRRVRVEMECPDRCTRGDELAARLRVANGSWLPRFLLNIRVGLAGSDASLLLVYTPARGSNDLMMDFNGLRRGVYSGSEVLLSSKAPIGLARGRRRLDVYCPLVVYPPWFPLAGDWGSGRRGSGYASASTTPARVPAHDYLGVREYRPEDSPRSIHWKTTARSNRLAVTEYARQTATTPLFLLDRFREADVGPAGESSFETAVSLAASLVQREAAHRRGFAIGGEWDEAVARGLDSDPEAAMLLLARLEADSGSPLVMETAPFWPGVTPVIILTSHVAYSALDDSPLITNHPQSITLMLDGRACSPTREQERRLMDNVEISGLAERLEAAGCRFLLVDPREDLAACLESL